MLLPGLLWAQKEEEAQQWGRMGIVLVDQQEYKDGIQLLTKAYRAHPSSFDYPFELGRAHILMGKHTKAEKYLYPLQYHADADPAFYVLLASCYDSLNKPRQQQHTYRYGIQKFPDAGLLYHELASFYVSRDSVAEGLGVCEIGLQHAPGYADNYALAARIMEAKGNALWAWWYGEVFLNLSDNVVTKRGVAKMVARNATKVIAGKWKPGPDPLEQAVSKAAETCGIDDTLPLIVQQGVLRSCFIRNFGGADPLSNLLREMNRQNILELYAAYHFGEVDKEQFFAWLGANAPEFERFKEWFYWNGLRINEPFTRHTITAP